MKSTPSRTIYIRRPFLAATFAVLAGSLSIAALVSGAACEPASKTVGFTGDPLVTGDPRLQVAAREQVTTGSQATNRDGVKNGAVSREDDAKIAKITARLLEMNHYAQVPINDELSPKVFDAFLDTLDPQRVFFLQTDIDTLSASYRDTIVGLTKQRGDFTAAQKMYTLLVKRAEEQTLYVDKLLKEPSSFTFTGSDTYVVNREKATRPGSATEAQALWKQRLRYEYLQEKLAKEKPADIVKTLSRRYDRSLRSLRELDSDDIFELYMNSIAHALDPHTDYFGKATAETFAISMRLSLFGIGATLRSEDGYTVIEDIKPGSPAQATKKIKAGDKIVGVAQGRVGAFVDVVDMKLNRVVEQIRGEKGSVVRLKYIPGDATDPSVREEVVIVRDEIKLEESEAKARLILQPQPDGKVLRLGVIDLPLFYQDPEKNKSCSADVALLLEKLKQEKVDGVILDLRRNGGGSLPEAIKMTGLFIKTGPVVQVRDAENNIRVNEDKNPAVAYDGPLVLLTSRNSASASEIVAGALQDYGRALVVGDSSSFGKGTVQAVYELGPIMEQNSASVADNPGQLKLTIQKFYRASGASTQLRGVEPEVVLPSIFDALKVGEKDLDNPLPWDEVESAKYTKLNAVAPYTTELTKRSGARVATDGDFRYLKDTIARVAKAQDQKTISLNEATRRKEQDEDDARIEARQKVLAARPVSKMTVYPLTLTAAMKPGLPKPLTPEQVKKGLIDGAEEDPLPTTEDKKKNKSRLPEPDVTLTEAENVLADYIALSKGSSSTPLAKQP
ncbi:MAG: carboxy terminal-processing peptidase [Akkermansiaceae bacterium]|nr:carboxy terminal-processing peptidase [Armatimonadota bacterium]